MVVIRQTAVRQDKCGVRLFSNPLYKHMKLFCTLILLSLACMSALTGPVKTSKRLSVQNKFSDSLKSGKIVITTVRLYPNPTSNGAITINSTIKETLHFYVFDLEGTLLHRINLRGKAR